jgi:1-acyl-sn-glycerol-3-phosphate acyltransferase
LIFPIWTAACVSAALFAGFVKGDPDFFYRAQRGWARGLLRVCGIELEVTGAERMDPDGAYVIVSNHASYMDIPALFAALPQLPQFLAKRELSRIPFLGAALRSGRHVLVDRDSRTSAKDSLDRAAQHLKAGAAILIFAEGTRSTRDEIARFKSGAFRLAKLGQVAILPVGISGTRAVLPKHGRLIRPRRVQVHIGEPISAHDVESTPMNELCDRTRRQVSELAGLPLSNEA